MRIYHEICKSEAETLALAALLANIMPERAIIYLEGQLGAGKTTFTRGFLRGLQYEDKVKSPTYTLVEPYESAGKTIFHFDFYRLKSAEELEYMGIWDYLKQDAICLIEWPEKGFPLLPSPDLTCKISIIGRDNHRDVSIEAQSALGEKVLTQLGW